MLRGFRGRRDRREGDIVVDADVRRAHALIRDEYRLRDALDRHENRRFDVETAVVLRERVEDLLETVDTVVRDEDFWRRLEDQAREPLTFAQLDRLRNLDAAALAALLQIAGYTTPPPPPAEDLVDDTLASVSMALDSHGDVRRAKAGLATLHYRVRYQIERLEDVGDLQAGTARTAARALGSGARWLIPKAVGVAAGAIVEAHTPGSGTGVVVGKTVQKIAEEGLEWAAASAMAWARTVMPGDAAVEDWSRDQEPLDPARLHAAALEDQLRVLHDATRRPEDESVAHLRQLLARARRHLTRLEQLSEDQDTRQEYANLIMYAREQLGYIRHELEWRI